MLSLHHRLLCGTILPLLVALAGCSGDGPKIVSVSGTLTYKGKPVPNVNIDFTPEQGRASLAQTDAEGRFTVKYADRQEGAIVGKHKISVRPNPLAEQRANMENKKYIVTAEMKELFDRYSSEK